eukprot:COSAG02_NODE_128_length_34833_cov_44.465221_34_plen_35_part_00
MTGAGEAIGIQAPGYSYCYRLGWIRLVYRELTEK